ncbi:MAG TPA: hypothetical protein DDZ92_03845 [Halomonas sp.]|nr:hypothetical protein [Halomonas sp.]
MRESHKVTQSKIPTASHRSSQSTWDCRMREMEPASGPSIPGGTTMRKNLCSEAEQHELTRCIPADEMPIGLTVGVLRGRY